MGLMDDAKAKLEEVKVAANDAADKISEKADIAKQRVEGEADKANGDKVKGEAKIQASKARDELNK